MLNPMLNMLNRPRMSGGNNILSQIATVKNLMTSGNPQQIVQAEMQRNPAFAQFVNDHQNRSIDDLIAETGIDPAIIRSLL